MIYLVIDVLISEMPGFLQIIFCTYCHFFPRTVLIFAFIHSLLFSKNPVGEGSSFKTNIQLHPYLVAGIYCEIPLTTSSGLWRQKFNYYLLFEFDFALLGTWAGRANFLQQNKVGVQQPELGKRGSQCNWFSFRGG